MHGPRSRGRRQCMLRPNGTQYCTIGIAARGVSAVPSPASDVACMSRPGLVCPAPGWPVRAARRPCEILIEMSSRKRLGLSHTLDLIDDDKLQRLHMITPHCPLISMFSSRSVHSVPFARDVDTTQTAPDLRPPDPTALLTSSTTNIGNGAAWHLHSGACATTTSGCARHLRPPPRAGQRLLH